MTVRIAVVTGANKGLGFAIVKALCKEYEGKVYLTSRDKIRGENACEELRKTGIYPAYFQLDITDSNSIENFVEHVQKQNEKIEILVNNAGILFLKEAPEPKLQQTKQTLEINFFSLVNFTESVLPLVIPGGKIVNISSSSGHLSRIPSETLQKALLSKDLNLEQLKNLMYSYIEAVETNQDVKETWGESPYVVSKVGVNAYTFILHRRLTSKGIYVNSVHPGYVISDMTNGVGNVSPEAAARLPVRLALQSQVGGLFIWHDGSAVPWDGPDPRGFIDNIKL